MADNIDKLVAMMAETGNIVTREVAEQVAIRVAGSVDAYIAEIEQTRIDLAQYEPLPAPPGGVSDKFSQTLD